MEDKSTKYLTSSRNPRSTQYLLCFKNEEEELIMEFMSLLYLQIFQRPLIQSIFVKLKAHGFSANPLNLMHSHLNNREEKVQINNKFSLGRNVITGALQGSISGPLLFN